MSWMVLHVIGIMAYSASGALVAIEAGYSFVGVFVLGLTTSFGGAVVRNIIIESPVSTLWQSETIIIVFLTLTLIMFLPINWTHHWKKWGLFFDSIGLATFAIQGALAARYANEHVALVLLSAMFTGLGGGMIRDILAGKKPLALKEEIHAVLTIFCGFCIWIGWTDPIQLTLLVFGIVMIRMLAIKYKWSIHLPCSFKQEPEKKVK